MSFSVNYSAAEQVMREINFTSRVSVRYDAEACVTRIMRETWQVHKYFIMMPRVIKSKGKESAQFNNEPRILFIFKQSLTI